MTHTPCIECVFISVRCAFLHSPFSLLILTRNSTWLELCRAFSMPLLLQVASITYAHTCSWGISHILQSLNMPLSSTEKSVSKKCVSEVCSKKLSGIYKKKILKISHFFAKQLMISTWGILHSFTNKTHLREISFIFSLLMSHHFFFARK